MNQKYSRVKVPMRDGVELDATVFEPAEAGPVLLLFSPYGIDATPVPHPDVSRVLQAGYGVVWVACRGTFGSGGTFRRLSDEASDGFDTVEWVIAQRWSNGAVGTYGGSYQGMAQWALASQNHPAVKASAVSISAMDTYRGAWFHPGGALALSTAACWHLISRLNEAARAVGVGSGQLEDLMRLAAGMPPGPDLYEPTPLTEHPLLGTDARWTELLAHPSHDAYWQALDFRQSVPQMNQPVLFVAGWYDVFVIEQLADYERYATQSGSAVSRSGSRLVIGPWDHLTAGSNFPDRDFGQLATPLAADLEGEHLRHFDRWLREESPGAVGTAPVKLFVMGINQWREESAWPLPDTLHTDYYVHVGDSRRAGALQVDPPANEASIGIVYDPSDPVPTTGGSHIGIHRADGPADQRPLDGREDILTFQTDPVVEDTELTGYVTATLFVSSDALDTDFTVKLCDVDLDGRSLHLCDGIVRTRYRNSLENPEPLVPGDVYEVQVQMAATSNVFRAGHRIRVDISSSNFPRFDRNTNTGLGIQDEALTSAKVAHNVVHVGPEYPSRVNLPRIVRPR